jgi:hypothetical protein
MSGNNADGVSVMESVEGSMNELGDEKRKVAEEALDVHSAAMKTLKSKFRSGHA